MEKSYVKGILGAILGGMIASLPWILAYVYGNMIIAALAIIIAIGSLKGYQLLNGKVDKKLPYIIAIISVLCVTISTLVIIPLLLLIQEGVGASLANLQTLYENSEFFGALMGDYAISVVFTLLGISGVIKSISSDIKNSKDESDIKVNIGNGTKQDKENIKSYFLSRNAIDENSAIELEEQSNLNEKTLAYLINQTVVVKKGNKYYYSEDKEKVAKKDEKKTGIIIFIIFAVLIGAVVLTSLTSEDDPTTEPGYRVEKEVSFNVPEYYVETIDEEEEYGWYYVHKDDISGATGYISVFYFEGELDLEDEETLKAIKDDLETGTGVKKVTQGKPYTTSTNEKAIEYIIECEDYIDYVYYITGNNKVAGVEIIDFGEIENLAKDGKT